MLRWRAADPFAPALNLAARRRDESSGLRQPAQRTTAMRITLLVLLGLLLGALGGAALGIGAGLAWVELFRTSSLEGDGGTLVFLTFMPLGAAIGGVGGALLFGVIAIRDAEIAIAQQAVRRRDR